MCVRGHHHRRRATYPVRNPGVYCVLKHTSVTSTTVRTTRVEVQGLEVRELRESMTLPDVTHPSVTGVRGSTTHTRKYIGRTTRLRFRRLIVLIQTNHPNVRRVCIGIRGVTANDRGRHRTCLPIGSPEDYPTNPWSSSPPLSPSE